MPLCPQKPTSSQTHPTQLLLLLVLRLLIILIPVPQLITAARGLGIVAYAQESGMGRKVESLHKQRH